MKYGLSSNKVSVILPAIFFLFQQPRERRIANKIFNHKMLYSVESLNWLLKQLGKKI